ncbi:hypothetical protein JMJ35_004294 [Cladonia borealis]|uniref:Major facilitator superfamily (MFS) profile domain-containing protein n=1 Tax=Cladonia borealis TaxID=184061 RepID=A0AA39R4S0_9LECA|nr:hypothetical protein JMJ35_004294 [Cladonia borealis]
MNTAEKPVDEEMEDVKSSVEKPSSDEVNWDDDDDPLNPMNWKASTRWLNLLVISMMAFITPLGSTMFAPGVPLVEKTFHFTDSNLATSVVSIYVLGFAVGPLFIAPLSETYGRQPVYIISMIFFVFCQLACALSTNVGMLLAFRFLAGCAGSTPVTIGAATIGDMFPRENRAGAMTVWGIGAQLGPILGPVIGGFLSQAKGWRWVFWLLTIISVVILERKAQRMIRETGNQSLVSALHDPTPPREVYKRTIIRPVKMLIFSPIVLLLSIYLSVVFGYFYLFLTTFTRVFQQQYGFGIGITGLTYLGLGFGSITGLIIAGKSSDIFYRRLTAKNHGFSKPEFRLPPLFLTSPLVTAAFFWYGWSAEAKTHWIVPILGTMLFGMGMMPAFMSIDLYLVDTYTRYRASAIAATKVLQSITGAVLPLAGPALYDRLGLGWGNSVLAFIAVAFFPIPFLFYRYGEKLRNTFTVVL